MFKFSMRNGFGEEMYSCYSRWIGKILLFLWILVFSVSSVSADLINVDIVSNSSQTFDGSSGLVLSNPDDHWNAMVAPFDAWITEFDSFLTAVGAKNSGVSLTFDDSGPRPYWNTWNYSVANSIFGRKIYLNSSQVPSATFTLAGLVPNSAYTLVLFGVDGNTGSTASRFTINGVTKSCAPGSPVYPLTEDKEYVRFTGNASAAGTIEVLMEIVAINGAFTGFELQGSFADIPPPLSNAHSPVPVNGGSVDATAVTSVSWQAPSHANIDEVTGYDVYFGTDPDVATNPKTFVTTPSLDVSLEDNTTYYWRVDAHVSWDSDAITGNWTDVIEGDFWTLSSLPMATLDPDPSWYVGDTTAGEWIEFEQVYFSEGDYRFTGHLGAVHPGNTVSLSLNYTSLGAVTVPRTGGFEDFELVHLGRTHLSAGYYDIRLTFITGDVSADMVYVRKSPDTSNSVIGDDIASPAPLTDDGSSVTPIVAQGFSNHPHGTSGYSDDQNMACYKQSGYTDFLWDEGLYAHIDEIVSARCDFGWLHGKYSVDTDDWGY